MKTLITICLLVGMLMVQGCKTYWYQPYKTLAECEQDSKECRYDALKHASPFDPIELYCLCMDVKGYQNFSSVNLCSVSTKRLPQIYSDDIFNLWYATGRPGYSSYIFKP